ncbi:TrmH family RNA methyltransferase [Paraliomyxa miuraensis]|uniref:TrmH family RNA methyltransferase n=1 Tax=Paraliomyxa miuraensis TaxID=376150 RepID=UPI002251D060|nr:RNA methyltransferase [Paraliomyxa miuraensis]
MVRDPADPRLRPFEALRERGVTETIVVEGELAVERALRSEHPVRALLLTPGHRERLEAAIPAGVEVLQAEAALLREVVGFDFHRGCLAVMERPRMPPLGAVVSRIAGGDGPRTVVVAEGLADPANLGAVIRNARAFGVDLLLHGRGAQPWSRRAIRAAMGLCFSLPVIGCEDLPAAVHEVQRGLGPGARTVAAVVGEGASALGEWRAPSRVVLLVGNEGAGLSEPLRARADACVTIPLAPGVDSLNVAAATAVLLWSLRSPSRGA